MARAPGLFGIPQFMRPPANKLAEVVGVTGTGAARSPDVVETGKVFVLAMYVCATCGSVELVDEAGRE